MYRRLAVFIDFIECYAATSLAADLYTAFIEEEQCKKVRYEKD